MKRILAALAAIVLAQVAWANDYEEFVAKQGYEFIIPVFRITLGQEAAAQTKDGDFSKAYCELVRKGHGMPIVIDSRLREEANRALGVAKTRQLLLPVARANNAVRCFCYSAEAKARAGLKCG